MFSGRLLLMLVAALALGSMALAAAWQFAHESPQPVTTAIAPASRSMFPKVLNH